MTTPPDRALAELCAVLEVQGYEVLQANGVGTRGSVAARHKGSLPVTVCLYEASVELFSQWPCTEAAKQELSRFLVFANELNDNCRLVTCVGCPEHLLLRACFPFPFDAGLFRAFLKAWLEDARDVTDEVSRSEYGHLLEWDFIQ